MKNLLADKVEKLDPGLAFLEFCNARNEWSEATFDSRESRNHVGPLKHLKKEIEEVLAETDPLKIKRELIDCVFLVHDAVWRAGVSFAEMVKLCDEKLAINKSRVWPMPRGDNEPVEHDRTKD